MKYLIIALLFISSSVFADGRHIDHDATPPPPPPTQTTTIVTQGNAYGMLALATSGNQFDWGVPDKLQLSMSIALTEGGNQAIAFGLGNRFGGVLISGSLAMTLDADNTQDDYAFVFNSLMHF